MSPTKKHLRKDDPPKTTPHIPVQYLFVNDHRSKEFLRLLGRYMIFTRTPRKPSKLDNAILHELPPFKAHGKPAPSSSLTHEADGQHHSAIENAPVVDAPSSGWYVTYSVYRIFHCTYHAYIRLVYVYMKLMIPVNSTVCISYLKDCSKLTGENVQFGR